MGGIECVREKIGKRHGSDCGECERENDRGMSDRMAGGEKVKRKVGKDR